MYLHTRPSHLLWDKSHTANIQVVVFSYCVKRSEEDVDEKSLHCWSSQRTNLGRLRFLEIKKLTRRHARWAKDQERGINIGLGLKN